MPTQYMPRPSLSRLHGVDQPLVVGGAQHVARGRIVAALDLAQRDGHRQDLRLRQHGALAVRGCFHFS